MKIHVTAEDIKEGLRGECDLCPIALALQRAGFKRPHVYDDTVEFGRHREKDADLPARAGRFVERFDEGKPVEPFSFELAAVPDSETVTP